MHVGLRLFIFCLYSGQSGNVGIGSGFNMKFVDFYGDNRLRHKIVFNRNFYSECIYCGQKAMTREHVPSKVFLIKPYPDHLSVVPACLKCNNSFSKDELFLSILIEMLKSKYYGQNYILSEEIRSRLLKNAKIVQDIERVIENNNLGEFDQRISKIIFKIALGHAVFELSEGYCIKNGSIRYTFFDRMSEEEVEEFSVPFIISDELLPEMGSRAYERIRVLEVTYAAVKDPEQIIKVPIVLLDWVEVQEAKYSYTSFRFEKEIVVKMIVNDFLYAEVILPV